MTYQPQTVWVGGRHPTISEHYYLRAVAQQDRRRLLTYIKASPGCSRGDLDYFARDISSRRLTDRLADLRKAKEIDRTRVVIRVGKGVNALTYEDRYTARNPE